MDATDFDARLARADLVITGEGRIDAQTAFGKTALGVAKRAQAAGVPCIAVGGGVEPEGIAALAAVGAIAVPVVERPQSVEEAMAAGTAPLERCGERLARLVSLLVTRPDRVGRPATVAPRPKPSAAPEEAQVLEPGRELREAARALPAGAGPVHARRAGRAATAARPGSAGSTRPAS